MLNNIDLTGAQFNFRLTQGNEKQKSQLGGVITFLVYLTSLLYAIYIFVLWGLGSLLPRVTSYQQVSNEVALDLPENFISFDLQSALTLFQQDNNILIPVMLTYTNDQLESVKPLFSQKNNNYIPLPNTKIVRSDVGQNSKEIMFILAVCNSELQFGQTCASEEVIQEQLSNLGSILTIDVDLTQYNQQSNKFDSVTKDSSLVIDNQYVLYNQLKLKTTYNKHDSGLLFENYQVEMFVNDREIVTQPVNPKFPTQYFEGFSPIFVTLITIDAVQTVTIIVEAKIGEVFAQIGAIVSILMTLQIISANYNSMKLEKQLKEVIVQYIYPKLKEIKIQKTFFGKVTQIQYYGKILTPEQQLNFISQYKRAISEANQYLAILTIIYKVLQIEQHLNLQNSQILEVESISQIDNNLAKIQPKERQEEIAEQQENNQDNDFQEIFKK